MSSPATNAIGVKLQAVGENLNTWGVSPNLNDALQVLANIGVKWNPITINGDTTISETNYSTTNDTEVAAIDLVAGTVAAAFNLVLPGRDKTIPVRNSSGYTATIKLSATSGFALPTGRIALVSTDGSTDVVNLTPNFGGLTTPTSGTRDIPAWSAVENAIATASIPASSGTVLVSGTDTTAKYLAAALTANVTTLTTTQVTGLVSLSLATLNAGANEQVALQYGSGYVGGFLPGGTKSAQFTPVAGTEYNCDLTAASWTINFTGMTTPQIGHRVKLNCFGNFAAQILGTIGGISNPVLDAGFSGELVYSSASWGWNMPASGKLIALAPIEYFGPGTYTAPIPDNCEKWECYVVGGGGSGGAVEGDTTNEMNASGGAGGSYAHGVRRPTAGATTITSVVGAGGAAVTETSGATNGNAGASSTASDGTITFTAPGGGAGQAADNGNAAAAAAGATGSVSDAGDVDPATGGASGASANTNRGGATGGGSPGGPWGNGKASGAVSGQDDQKSTGGASPLYVSGDSGTGAAQNSGGAGLGGASAAGSATGGGGGMGASVAAAVTAGAGVTAASGIPTRGGDGPTILQTAWGIGGVGAAGTAGAGSDGGGGGAATDGGGAAVGGAGGFKGGGGGAQSNSGNTTAGAGGLFAGGGGAAGAGANTITAGQGRAGGGGGGAVAWTNGGTAISGKGGDGYVCVIFYVKG